MLINLISTGDKLSVISCMLYSTTNTISTDCSIDNESPI